MVSQIQIRKFVKDGYIKIPGVVPKSLIDSARRAMNHSIGNVGMGGGNIEKNRSPYFCHELLKEPVILDLYNKTSVISIAESLLGQGNVFPVSRAKPYPRFPLPLGENSVNPIGHIDGIGNGTNGQAKGLYRRGFTVFAVIYLSDVPEPYSGNFTVWPKSHRFFESYFQMKGHEVLAEGLPSVELNEDPVMITGKAGDLILAHHQVLHGACSNASPDVRYATIARLEHKDCLKNGSEAYTDIWREWPGVQDVLKTGSIK